MIIDKWNLLIKKNNILINIRTIPKIIKYIQIIINLSIKTLIINTFMKINKDMIIINKIYKNICILNKITIIMKINIYNKNNISKINLQIKIILNNNKFLNNK